MATELLQQVISRIEALSPTEQDALAERMQTELDELEGAEEAEWDALVSSPASQDLLERWAAEALQEDDAGLTRKSGDEW